MGFLFKIKISFCCLLLMLFSISCLIEMETDIPESSQSYILDENTSESSVNFVILDNHPQHECLNLELNRFVDVFGI